MIAFSTKRKVFIPPIICSECVYLEGALISRFRSLVPCLPASLPPPRSQLKAVADRRPAPGATVRRGPRPFLHVFFPFFSFLHLFTHEDTMTMFANNCKPLCSINQFWCCLMVS